MHVLKYNQTNYNSAIIAQLQLHFGAKCNEIKITTAHILFIQYLGFFQRLKLAATTYDLKPFYSMNCADIKYLAYESPTKLHKTHKIGC